MKLPGSKEETIPELMDMIEETKENQEKVLEVEADGTISKRQTIYATYMYDTEVEGEIYMVYVPENVSKRHLYGSKEWLHNVLMKEYEAEVVEVTEIEEERHRDKMKSHVKNDNPREDIHVIVKTTDDGRYKDEYKFARETEEDDSRHRYIGGYNNEESRFEYIDLGTFNEVVNGDETYDFDLKKHGGRRTAVDLMTLTTKEERHEKLRDILQGEVS